MEEFWKVLKRFSLFILIILSLTIQLFAKSSYLSYEKTPKKVFINQVFEVELKVIITLNNARNIKTEFLKSKNVEILNQDSLWKTKESNTYTNKFFYKITDHKFKLPIIKIKYSSGKLRRVSKALYPFKLKSKKLNPNLNFSGVLAENLIITKYKSTNFDTQHNIVVLRIEAFNSNLGDFKLKFVRQDGINSKEMNLPETKIYYYLILEKKVNSFKFNYFNLTHNKFINFTIPIELSNDSVTTQIELNPNKNRFMIYKTIALGIVATLFLLISIFRRSIVFATIAIFIGIYTIYYQNPIIKVSIAKGTKVKILPTENSTIFYISQEKEQVQILNKREDLIKVLLPNSSVGWISDEDIIKN